MLFVVEGNSLSVVSHGGQEGNASIFDVMYDEGQPLTFGIVVSVSLRKSMTQLKVGINMHIPCLGISLKLACNLSLLTSIILNPHPHKWKYKRSEGSKGYVWSSEGHYKKMCVKATNSGHWNVQIDKCYSKHVFFVILHIHGEFVIF